MNPTHSIPVFREINDCHEATGFPIRSDLADFHAFALEDTHPAERRAMPPYRRGFHQISFIEEMADSTMVMDETSMTGAGPLLAFTPREQIVSWIRDGRERGFMVYFKEEALGLAGATVGERFPFFAPMAESLFALSAIQRESLKPQFQRLRELSASDHPYRRQQLAAFTLALLYDCLVMHDQREKERGMDPSQKDSGLVKRFRQMVATYYQDQCSVEAYAGCLNVSVDHLGAEVKKLTGRTPREFIEERVVLEAKRLLIHTDLGVGEIAFHLQFSEPTHFTRFFRRLTARTPLGFRRERLVVRS